MTTTARPEAQEAFPPELVGKFLFLSLFFIFTEPNGVGPNNNRTNGPTPHPRQTLQRPQQEN